MNVVYGEYLNSPGYVYAWELNKPLSLPHGSIIFVQSHKDGNNRALALVKEVSNVEESDIVDYGGRLPLPKVISALKVPNIKKQTYKFLD